MPSPAAPADTDLCVAYLGDDGQEEDCGPASRAPGSSRVLRPRRLTAMALKHRPDQMHAGPWLDRLFPIHLPDGRLVSVSALSVVPSNVGIMEGGLSPAANARQREKVLALAEKRHGGPLLVVEPRTVSLPEISRPGRPRERVPWMACMARLTSHPLDPDMISSELTLVWWQDAFDGPIAAEIERAAVAIPWERCAKDVDLP